jgi:hypothetical protein
MYNEGEHVLDTIETENKVFTCIVDYVTKRQVMIYDLTNENDPLFRLIAIKWKLYHYDMRFSIFKSKFFPTVKLPNVIVVNKGSIKYSTHDLKPTKPKRSKPRITT